VLTSNIWIRALWGGVIGVTVSDIILVLGRAAGAVGLNLLGSLAYLFTTQGVAYTPSGMILGFVIHLLLGALWALVFASVVRAFHSRHNVIAGLINGLLVWLVWGLALPPMGLGPQPWSIGTSTTVLTLISSLAYGLIVGYTVSEEAIGRKVRD
jgi:uncharacterized membrane protein YagU involved in acid resistance